MSLAKFERSALFRTLPQFLRRENYLRLFCLGAKSGTERVGLRSVRLCATTALSKKQWRRSGDHLDLASADSMGDASYETICISGECVFRVSIRRAMVASARMFGACSNRDLFQ